MMHSKKTCVNINSTSTHNKLNSYIKLHFKNFFISSFFAHSQPTVLHECKPRFFISASDEKQKRKKILSGKKQADEKKNILREKDLCAKENNAQHHLLTNFTVFVTSSIIFQNTKISTTVAYKF